MSDTVSKTIAALQAAGFRGERLKTAFGIVMRESSGNPLAHNTNRATGDNSYGLAQINMLGSMGPARRKQFGIRSNDQLLDPNVNARAMFQMSRGGKDFGAWGIGPNAYRSGAGRETIARYVNQFPGAHPAGEVGPVARAPSSPQPPAPDNRRQFGLALLAQLIGKRSPIISAAIAHSQQQEPTPAMPHAEHAAQPSGHPPPLAQLRLPAVYQGTHVTDGLGWGSKTAKDFMARPGTTVGSPVDGVVEYFHPTGAQGGGSELIRSLDGRREVWLGHIAQGLRPGTRVRRGQRVAVVANQHVSAPHVHEDIRRI